MKTFRLKAICAKELTEIFYTPVAELCTSDARFEWFAST